MHHLEGGLPFIKETSDVMQVCGQVSSRCVQTSGVIKCVQRTAVIQACGEMMSFRCVDCSLSQEHNRRLLGYQSL